MRGKLLLPLLSVSMLGFAIFHVVNAGVEPPKPAPLISPAASRFESTLAASGIIEPKSENIAVGSPLPGVVVEVLVKVGDSVYGPSADEKGTPLFRLDDRQLRAELQVRQSMLIAAQANLTKLESMPRPEEVPPSRARVREAKSNLDDQRDQYMRAQKLYADRAIGEEEAFRRKQAYQTAQAQLERAEAELALLLKGAWDADKAVARAAVEQAQASINQTLIELDRLIIRAPVSGQILQCNVRPGEFVGAPPGQPLIVLGDLTTLHVRADIDENDVPIFRTGLAGYAIVRGAPSQQHPLQFVRIEPYVVPKKSLTGSSSERVDTRVLQVIFRINPGDAPLFVGQQVDVFLNRAVAAKD